MKKDDRPGLIYWAIRKQHDFYILMTI